MKPRSPHPEYTALRRARSEAVHRYLTGLAATRLLYRSVAARFIGVGFVGRGAWSAWTRADFDQALSDLADVGILDLYGGPDGEVWIDLIESSEPMRPAP